MRYLDTTYDSLVYPLHSTADQAVAPAMVEVKGRLRTGKFTFVFLADSFSEQMIRNYIFFLLTGEKNLRRSIESHFTLCRGIELMNPKEIFAPPENTEGYWHKYWPHTRIRAHCPQNVGQFAPG